MERLKTVGFERIVRWVKRNHTPLTIFTLNGESYIIVSVMSDGAICITGSTGVSISVDSETWGHAMDFIERIDNNKDTWKSTSYARPNVISPELRDITNFGPSFPAICKAYWAYHKR